MLLKTILETMRLRLVVCLLLVINTGLTYPGEAQSKPNQFIVVLDAGHGGKDPGAISNGYKEKEIALNVALELGSELEQHKDIRVIYTRKTDKFVELWKRADIANKADADLFISIHCNSVNNPTPYGTETWVLGENNADRNFEFAKKENEVIFLEDNYEENYSGFDPSSPESTIAIGIEQEVYIEQSIVLARSIEDSFINKAKRKSRGLKQHSLLVIRNTYMPSILVELGFISNKSEGAFLNSKAGQAKMSLALKEAILEFKKELDQNVGQTFYVNPSEISSSNDSYEGVEFKVQLAASSRKLATKPYNFKGLDPVTRGYHGDLYRYYYGSTSDYNKAQDLQAEARNGGYPSAYIVAFRNGERVSLETVLKSKSN
jgi:N-acetylmuramoyl-L-alanine amidase